MTTGRLVAVRRRLLFCPLGRLAQDGPSGHGPVARKKRRGNRWRRRACPSACTGSPPAGALPGRTGRPAHSPTAPCAGPGHSRPPRRRQSGGALGRPVWAPRLRRPGCDVRRRGGRRTLLTGGAERGVGRRRSAIRILGAGLGGARGSPALRAAPSRAKGTETAQRRRATPPATGRRWRRLRAGPGPVRPARRRSPHGGAGRGTGGFAQNQTLRPCQPRSPCRRLPGLHSSPCTKTVPNRPLTHRAPALTTPSLGLVTRTILLSCVVNSSVQPTPQNGQMVRVVA